MCIRDRPNKMKVREEKLRTIIEWSEKNEDVRVLLLTSSLVNPLALVDEFSDLAVSYTHLDVYKRQGISNFESIDPSARLMVLSSFEIVPCSPASNVILYFLVYSKSVSYTHL